MADGAPDAPDMTVAWDVSPRAIRQAGADADYRDWLLRPIVAALGDVTTRLGTLETTMADGFTDLQGAVQAISGEGGEITQATTTILAAIDGLHTITTTLQTELAASQAALADAQAQIAAGQQVATESVTTLQHAKEQFDTAEQQLNDAAAALQPPAPEPTPAPEPQPAPTPEPTPSA